MKKQFLSLLCLGIYLVLSHSLHGYPMGQPYGQPRMGVMGALSQRNAIDNIEDFKRDQAKKIADLEADVKDFNLWLGKESILDYYNRVLSAYNNNATVQASYMTYLQNAATKKDIPVTPAGYRLPQYRYTFSPLSEALDKLAKIQDTLDEHKRVASVGPELILGPKKRIAELRDQAHDYDAEYIHPNKLTEQPATPDIIQRSAIASNNIDALEQKISTVRTGLQNYLYKMGISDTGLNDNPNDMADMAKECEEKIKQVTSDPFSLALQKEVLKRYTTAPSPSTNPFSMPLPLNGSVMGVSVAEFPEKLQAFQALVNRTDQEIRAAACPNKTLVESITPADQKVYFTDTAIPPDINTIQANTDVTQYMYQGYLGYWLQQLANKVLEINLSGALLIAERLAIKKITDDLISKYLSPIPALFPDLKEIAILKDPSAPEIPLALVKKGLANGITENSLASYQGTLAAYNKALGDKGFINVNVKNILAKDPLYLQCPEGIGLRKTLLILAMLTALTSKKPFNPATYTTDIFGPVPASLFPNVISAEAPEVKQAPDGEPSAQEKSDGVPNNDK